MKLYQPSTIKYIQEKYGFKITKSLGQNFLTDKNIIDRIVSACEIKPCEDLVIEIGPGIGVITYELAEDAAKVIAIEIDKNLLPVLGETLADCPNVEIINQDVLKTDMNEVIRTALEELNRNNLKIAEELRAEGQTAESNSWLGEGFPKHYGVKIVGNLPYYITTPIIMKILEEGVKADRIVVMMQKEVADRIKATPGGKDYGALSVAVQYYCEVETAVKVPKESFVPRPQVDSTVLVLKPREMPAAEVADRELFFDVVRAGFNQRRKTLNNALMGVKGMTKEILAESLSAAGIDPVRRAETLSIPEFAELANEIKSRM